MMIQSLSPALQTMQTPAMRTAPAAARFNHGTDGADLFTRSSSNAAQSSPKFGMLVLSRKLGEKIFIGENICITVVDIDRGKIRLGVEAPRDVAVYRSELLPKIPA